MSRYAQEPQRQWFIIIVTTTLGLAVVFYKLYFSILPNSAEYLAQKVPAELYQLIGEASLKSFDESEFTPSQLSQEQQQQINESYQNLLTQLQLPEDKYSLYFRQWSQGMNAFALMDGSIVLTDTLVEKLTPDQLNAVLLHEIGHIEHNHMMENTIRVSLFYISLSLLFGDISVVSDLLIETSTAGLSLSYSRELEQQADTYATTQLLALSGNAKALESALQILYQQDKGDKPENFHWLNTHPSYEARIESIRSNYKTDAAH